MIKLAGFAGSLRKESFNRALLRSARDLMPSGAELVIFPIDDIPLYNADVERDQGIPGPVQALKEGIAECSGLVIATPEYNNSIPGVAKNVIDWVSRPPDDVPRVLRDKAVLLMGASPGGFGTVSSQTAWLPVLRTLRMKLWVSRGPFYVSRASDSIGPEGIKDPDLESRLKDYLAAFVEELSGAG